MTAMSGKPSLFRGKRRGLELWPAAAYMSEVEWWQELPGARRAEGHLTNFFEPLLKMGGLALIFLSPR